MMYIDIGISHSEVTVLSFLLEFAYPLVPF